MMLYSCVVFFFFKQKTAYEMRISDWSSDVCSSDLDEAEACFLCLDPAFGEEAVNDESAITVHMIQKDGPPIVVDYFKGQVSEKIGRASCRERVCQYV